jgi:putative transposase
MDGRGRALDNIFVERLWRTVKYEEVYLKQHDTVQSLLILKTVVEQIPANKNQH